MKQFSGKSLPHVLTSLIFLVAFATNLRAQGNFWKSKNAYLGQKPPGELPQVFAKDLLKDSGIVLGRVSFSKDGKEFYYSFARHWFASEGSGTKEIKFDGSSWQKPVVIAEDITNPAFSRNYDSLFLGGAGSKVWTLKKTAAGWSQPEIWLEKAYGLYNFQGSDSGTYYAGSNANQGSKSDYSSYDFCQFTINGDDTAISSLGNVINTAAFDGDFFIAPDESYIIISAKETKNFESELWISFRKKNKSWSEPLSLGAKINDGLAHRFGQYVSPGNKYLFYTRGTSEADCNIYWVNFDKIFKKLKRQAFK